MRGFRESVRRKEMEGLRSFLSSDAFWIGFGFAGQAVFLGAFLVQWLASEKRKRSHIPISFWYLRIFGSLMLLALTIQMWQKTDQSMVLVAGYAGSCVVYVRNLVLIRRHKALVAAGVREPDKWEDA